MIFNHYYLSDSTYELGNDIVAPNYLTCNMMNLWLKQMNLTLITSC